MRNSSKPWKCGGRQPKAVRLFDTLATKATAAASRLHVRSALNPMLWLCGIITIPAWLISAFLGDQSNIGQLLAYVGAAPPCALIVGFFYFMLTAPDKLQSEDYQLRHETLELIRQKGSNIEIAPSSLDRIANPRGRALPRRPQ